MKYNLFFFLLLFFSATISAQDLSSKQTPFVLGVIEKIQSAVLKEERTLNIYLPEGYAADAATTYPVIYLLDGSANEDFVHVVGVVQFLTMIAAMPKSIVVGIANIDRRRDFTFPTSNEKDKKDFPTTGSSATFMNFIEKELQPFVQLKYKANHISSIIGQSLGGLFAAEVLLKKPGLFDNYIIVSPSLWWDDESLLKAARGLLDQQADKSIRVYISVGTEGKIMEGDAEQLTALLKASGKKKLQVDFLQLPKEDHLTILHNSVYKGLQLLYTAQKTPENSQHHDHSILLGPAPGIQGEP